MDKKVVKIKAEEKKLREDIKHDAKVQKDKPVSNKITLKDVITGKVINERKLFYKGLEINNEKKRTALHDGIDKDIKNLPDLKGNHMKKVITAFKVICESEYQLKKRPYKDRDERFNNFQIAYYASQEFEKYYAMRSATGDKTAYKKVIAWKKDAELINNTWKHINSRSTVESKQKIIDIFKKNINLTIQRLK